MRARSIPAIIFFCLFVIILRLWFWQVFMSSELIAKAQSQRESTQTITADRGLVYFSDGTLLASVEPKFSLFAQPKIIKDKSLVAKKLAIILWDSLKHSPDLKEDEAKLQKLDIEEKLLDRLSKDLFWVSLGWKVSLETKLKVDNEKIFGVGADTILTRFYPEGSSSAHILGFVGANAYGDETGYFGIEGFYNGELKGKNGSLLQDRDAQGQPILIGTYKVKQAKSGKTLNLNIDRVIQHVVEEKLKLGIQKFGAKGASAIVMDPNTGGILALASYPNYDPADVGSFPAEFFKNPITVDGYEPGSTFKVLVMAAAINEGLVTPETICDTCSGPVDIGGYTIRTWNNQYEPNSDMSHVIVHSDNTGMVFVAKKLGLDKMYSYIQDYGFGNLTGVDLQDENSTDIRAKKDWHEIDLATASFGQGISVTAMQVVRAVSAIANGGNIMEPHIVGSIKDDDTITLIKPKIVKQVIKPEAAKLVTQMMVRAVDEGEAKFFKPKGFSIAGKTGTAQIPVAGHYDPNKTIASFVGFAPADKPRFVMLVRYDQPSASIYGAETAAPTFFEIAKEIFTHFQITPTEK